MIVLMMPDYRRDNPYQELLAGSLKRCGVEAVFPQGYRRLLPIFRASREQRQAKVLHLHWTRPYLRGRSLALQACYAAKLLLDVLLVRLTGRKVVWTLHNTLPHETSFPRLERFMRRLLCRIATHVIVHTQQGKEDAMKHLACPPHRLRVIPHGHYREVYEDAVPQTEAACRLGIDPAQKIFLFFGMIRPYKGLQRLLESWNTSAPAGTLLLIAGRCLDRAYANRLQTQIDRSRQVHWVDAFIPAEEVPLYFSLADVVVLPFVRIQTSGSLILAMSYGRPVIAPRLGDLPCVLAGADDLLYCPDDPEGLDRMLAKAADSDLSSQAERTAQACDRLNWNDIARQTAELYGAQTSCLPAEEMVGA